MVTVCKCFRIPGAHSHERNSNQDKKSAQGQWHLKPQIWNALFPTTVLTTTVPRPVGRTVRMVGQCPDFLSVGHKGPTKLHLEQIITLSTAHAHIPGLYPPSWNLLWVEESGNGTQRAERKGINVSGGAQYSKQVSGKQGFPGGSVVKHLPANAGDAGSIPGSGRSPAEGNGSPLPYSCLENPVNRGTWWATVRGVAKELDMAE